MSFPNLYEPGMNSGYYYSVTPSGIIFNMSTDSVIIIAQTNHFT